MASCRLVRLAKRLAGRMNAQPRMINSPEAKRGGKKRLKRGAIPCSSPPSFSYVAALELRIEKLEKRLAYARSRRASVAQHESEPPPPTLGPGPEPDRKDSLATIRDAIHRKAARKRENSDVNSLMADFGFL
jgi:hypothetical protein